MKTLKRLWAAVYKLLRKGGPLTCVFDAAVYVTGTGDPTQDSTWIPGQPDELMSHYDGCGFVYQPDEAGHNRDAYLRLLNKQ